MAVVRTPTLLSIDQWAQILQISPWDINQFGYPGGKTAQCQDTFFQYGWQKDHLSREEIGEAIAAAEKMIADELMWWPAPHFEVDEPIPYPRPHQPQLYGYAGTPRGEWKTVGARWHKFIKGGVLNRTFIGQISAGSLTKQDLDSDGVYEQFTATITDAAIGTITNVEEIALYFSDANRHGEPLDETWRIRPVKVSIMGNTATIIGHRTLLANPTPEYATNAAILDAKTDANYVTTVECYRTFVDDTATSTTPYQGVAMWKTVPGCGGSGSGCEWAIAPLCLSAQQSEQGQLVVDFGEACTWPFPTREPDKIQVNYVSGMPLVNGKMEHTMAQMVAYLSTALLANEKCGCDRTNQILAKYRSPIAKFVDKSVDAISYQEGTNTFPMTYGAQWAYSRIRQNRHVEAVGI